MKRWLSYLFIMCLVKSLFALPANIPYTYHPNKKTAYRSLNDMPSSLDPQSVNEVEPIYILEQIYEPLYSFEYGSHPYKVIPLLADGMPKLKFYDKDDHELLNRSDPALFKTVYTISIKPHVTYQPHPGFCEILKVKDCKHYRREVVANDFVYAIKRSAQASVSSPIVSVLKKNILGYGEYLDEKNPKSSISGLKVLNRYTFQMTTYGYTAQWIFWLSRIYFIPIPWEIDKYYKHIGNHQIWRRYSIGTGPFMLYNNNSNQGVLLQKNPHFRASYFHSSNKSFEPLIGKKLPLMDEIYFHEEKEKIPKWNKFLQGYYDMSYIPAESFENSIQVSKDGQFSLTDELKNKHFRLFRLPADTTYGLGFNMLDPVYGGYDVKAQKLRQAVSIAFDYEDYSSIFYNGRDSVAHGPIPSGIVGAVNTPIEYNSFVFKKVGNQVKQRSIAEAKKLLAEAGYPNAIDPKTHQRLILNLDLETSGLPEEKSRMDWYRKQAQRLGLELNIRGTDRNRFNQKLTQGETQLFVIGWGADYPDAENFLFLFYSKNQKAKHGGPNYSNFSQIEYDKLYDKLITLPEGPEKLQTIKAMTVILQQQSPWIWGTHGNTLVLYQNWVYPYDPSAFTNGILQYFDIHLKRRLKEWSLWNRFHYWPLLGIFLGCGLFILPFIFEWSRIKRKQSLRTPF